MKILNVLCIIIFSFVPVIFDNGIQIWNAININATDFSRTAEWQKTKTAVIIETETNSDYDYESDGSGNGMEEEECWSQEDCHPDVRCTDCARCISCPQQDDVSSWREEDLDIALNCQEDSATFTFNFVRFSSIIQDGWMEGVTANVTLDGSKQWSKPIKTVTDFSKEQAIEVKGFCANSEARICLVIIKGNNRAMLCKVSFKTNKNPILQSNSLSFRTSSSVRTN